MNCLLFHCPHCNAFQRGMAVLLPGDKIPCKCGQKMTIESYDRGIVGVKA